MNVKIIDLKKSILEDNDADADLLREELKDQKLFCINVMSSPGSGKTTTILRTISALKDEFKFGVMEADIDASVDAETVMNAGIPAVQLHTGGMCHLDAQMTRQGLAELDGDFDCVILENVGNLVCPAEFDTGCTKNVVIYSIPEGDDKPLKYPLMFQKADVVLINKVDAAPVFDFDMDKAKENIHMRNPNAVIFAVSSLTGEGYEPWIEYLREMIRSDIRG